MGYAKIRTATDTRNTEARNRAIREAAHMTTAQLAQAARVTPSTIRRIKEAK